MATSRLETLLLSKLEALPSCPLSPILSGALERLDEADVNPQELAEHIGRDPQLAERLMATAIQHTGRRLHSIEQTIRLVGLRMLKCYLSQIAKADGHSPGLDPLTLDLMQGQLLVHSEQVGICSHLIAHDVGYRHLPEAYTAGLLHDLGRALLSAFAFEELSGAMRICQTKATSSYGAEDAALGFNHSYIGAMVLEHWGMPSAVIEAVAYHHVPRRAMLNPRLTQIVHLADMIMNCQQAKLPIGSSLFPIDLEVLVGLDLTKERLQFLAEQATKLFGKVQEQRTPALT